ncbi:MAG: DUF3515 family protein [Candidatus Nanopelagicales bacterium]
MAALAFALPVAACGRQVDVAPPESPSTACASVTYPETVAGAGRRPTTQEGTAAWGEPPITLRCGVPRPTALAPTSQLIDVDGVDWLPIQGQGGAAFVAVDWPSEQAPAYVEVIVPGAYAAPADVLADISPALRG